MQALLLFLGLTVFREMPLLAIPDAPAAIFPTNNAVYVGISPRLTANVSSSNSSTLTVTFYGRVTPPGPDFTVAVLPDSQYYVASLHSGTPAMFTAQANWIVNNRVAQNIAYVAHEGDCVEHGDYLPSGAANLTEWQNGTNAMYRIENPLTTLLTSGVPYGVAVGNHDCTNDFSLDASFGTTASYNRYFGVDRFSSRSYYGGHYSTNNDSHYDFFSAGGLNFIVVFLRWDQTNSDPSALTWANNVLRSYPDRRAIVVSHYIGNPGVPGSFGPQGQRIYDTLKGNSNLFLMLSGHVVGCGQRQDTYNGYTVNTVVANYQFYSPGGGTTYGGNGYMRIMQFSPSNNVIHVTSYSPYRNAYYTDSTNQFDLSYNMQPGGSDFSFRPLGTNYNVASGSNAVVAWPSPTLKRNVGYDWYVTVDDGTNTVTSPTWHFTTAITNSRPVASNLVFTITGDTSSNLNLAATDFNGDALTYFIINSPQHGIVQSFNSSTGFFIYAPVHGFRGSDSMSYFVSDGLSSSYIAAVTLNVPASLDSDGDGIPDEWMLQHFGHATGDSADGSLATDDVDGDGMTTLQEYLADTDPQNSSSLLRIVSTGFNTNGFFVLSWASVGGTRYRVEYSDGSADGGLSGVFNPISNTTVSYEVDPAPRGTASTRSFTDDYTTTGGPSASGMRYYRIRVVQ